jgi:hypothetical protein
VLSAIALTWFVDHVMNPSLTLLNTKIPPFRFRHQMSFRDQLGYILGQHDMPVTETWGGRKFDKYLYTNTSKERNKLVSDIRKYIQSYCGVKATRNIIQLM